MEEGPRARRGWCMPSRGRPHGGPCRVEVRENERVTSGHSRGRRSRAAAHEDVHTRSLSHVTSGHSRRRPHAQLIPALRPRPIPPHIHTRARSWSPSSQLVLTQSLSLSLSLSLSFSLSLPPSLTHSTHTRAQLVPEFRTSIVKTEQYLDTTRDYIQVRLSRPSPAVPRRHPRLHSGARTDWLPRHPCILHSP